ncbi:MAG: hypothetical protein U0835_21865 [Isosphaeraceae bacterium]
MRRVPLTTLALALALSAAQAAAAPADYAGRWKLVVLPFGTDEFVVAELKPADGKVGGSVLSAMQMLGARKTVEGKVDGDAVSLNFPGQGVPLSFNGVMGKDGKAYGTIKYSSATYPARLEKTTADKVETVQPPAARNKILTALRETDAKGKVAKLLDAIKENPGHPMNALAYTGILPAAEQAGLTAEQVRGHISDWIADAKPYGDAWVGEVTNRALKAIQGKKAYATIATEMAQAAEKALPADAPLDTRASITGILATSARLAGLPDIAGPAEAKVKEFDARLDAEYHEKVPPFKPDTFERKGGKGGRAVVMEIFTGAECPPCVAADVGFDALLKTYKPTEFIGLQYHLHIPGPDPLTNADTVARQKYYGTEVRGTPSTFFDGKSEAGGGGGMANAQAKYQQYRGLIDPELEKAPQADVSVTATRTDDELKITANASATGAGDKAKPKLRLVLVEESVRYPGGNKLRFHHNVVRALPGGAEGKALENGKGKVEVTLKLSDLRKAQASYLADSGKAFPNPLPPVDLDDLAVVAFVQDDADHSVWNGVQVPSRPRTPDRSASGHPLTRAAPATLPPAPRGSREPSSRHSFVGCVKSARTRRDGTKPPHLTRATAQYALDR